MTWQRTGRLFVPSGDDDWAVSHASTPFAISKSLDEIQVYFTSRSSDGRSHIGTVTMQRDAEGSWIPDQPRLVLDPGEVGLFDEAGVAMGSIISRDGVDYLFYLGWSLRVTVPWANTIGVAVRAAGSDTFVRSGRVPILDRAEVDPYSMSYPWVVDVGGTLRMWYGTNRAWGSSVLDMDHVIRRASLAPDDAWERDLVPALDHQTPDEYALARPCVIASGDGFEMYVSSRSLSTPNSYHLAAATSEDARSWVRRDELAALAGPVGDWETEMQCYACVFDHFGQRLMLYNGNGFGATGFGMATATT